jgi:hypothetical protein
MMKKIIRILSVIAFLAIGATFNNAFSQPNPGNQSNGSSTGGAPIGGSAPIGSGMLLLITMAAGYAVKKAFKVKKDQIEQL